MYKHGTTSTNAFERALTSLNFAVWRDKDSRRRGKGEEERKTKRKKTKKAKKMKEK